MQHGLHTVEVSRHEADVSHRFLCFIEQICSVGSHAVITTQRVLIHCYVADFVLALCEWDYVQNCSHALLLFFLF